MKPTLQLAIAPQLHEDELVDQEAHEVKRLRALGTVFWVVGHYVDVGGMTRWRFVGR
jgi:hypothetical protein